MEPSKHLTHLNKLKTNLFNLFSHISILTILLFFLINSSTLFPQNVNSKKNPELKYLINWLENQNIHTAKYIEFKQIRNLKFIKKPRENTGKMYINKNGDFSCQIGNPIKIFVCKYNETLKVANVKKNTYKIINKDDHQNQKKYSLMFEFLSSHPNSIEQINTNFDIKSVSHKENKAIYNLKPLNHNIKKGIKYAEFHIDTKKNLLVKIFLKLKDNSELHTYLKKIIFYKKKINLKKQINEIEKNFINFK